MTSGWLSVLAPEAPALMMRCARARLAPGEGDPSSASSSYLRHSVQLVFTVFQCWNACRIHATAAEYFELHRDLAAHARAPWPVGVDRRSPGSAPPGPGVTVVFAARLGCSIEVSLK